MRASSWICRPLGRPNSGLFERDAARAEEPLANLAVVVEHRTGAAPPLGELHRCFVHDAAVLHTLVEPVDLQREPVLLVFRRRIEAGSHFHFDRQFSAGECNRRGGVDQRLRSAALEQRKPLRERAGASRIQSGDLRDLFCDLGLTDGALRAFALELRQRYVDVVQAVDAVHHRVVLCLAQQHSVAALDLAETLFDPPRGFARQVAQSLEPIFELVQDRSVRRVARCPFERSLEFDNDTFGDR